MFSIKRCVGALFSLQWDSPFNTAEMWSRNMLSKDVANHRNSHLHGQNKKSGRYKSRMLRTLNLAKCNVVVG